jgi:peptidoglycan/xylan/chitin deacetylase (PgdA/CDA1 family)
MGLFRPCFFHRILYPDAIFRIKTSEKILFLTFDDGPDPESTPEVLNILNNNKVRAIFFCNGEAAEKYPDLVEKIKETGHLVGNHGYDHLNGWKTSIDKYCDDINLASHFTSGNLFRPPYGRLTINQYKRLRKSFRIIFWDIMCYDFDRNFGAERSLSILNRKLRSGSIIVLHDTTSSTCNTFLNDFIEMSISNGYRFEVLIKA